MTSVKKLSTLWPRNCLLRTVCFLIGLCCFVLEPSDLFAASKHNDVCDKAAEAIALQSDVPVTVLKAISRTETGRLKGDEVVPWPWTVNMEGKGVWFDTADAARAYAYKHYKRGARSFDVGCFQLNYKWHHQAFSSIEEMFEPIENTRYAAEFLSRLYREFGNWEEAVGAYHSRTPKFARKYMKAYAQHFEAVTERTENGHDTVARADRPTRTNNFPLLTSKGEARTAGSLTQLSSTGGSSIFHPASPMFEPQS